MRRAISGVARTAFTSDVFSASTSEAKRPLSMPRPVRGSIVKPSRTAPCGSEMSSTDKRENVTLFAAKTNDEILFLHRAEKANLIVSRVDLPGMPCERLIDAIRSDELLRAVSLILFCEDRPEARARAEKCRPNAVLPLPLDSALLFEHAGALLDVHLRKAYRVLLSVQIDGSSKDRAFFCRSENISASGLLLETEKDLAVGDHLTCSFFLPDARRITLAGEVVRSVSGPGKSETKRYGVKFRDVSAGDGAALDVFVMNHLSKTPRSPAKPASPESASSLPAR
jgi:PilZ domain